MSEKQFKLSSETVLQYQIMDNDTDLNENEVVDLLNKLYEENERLRNQLERKTILLKIRTKHIDDRAKSFQELLNYLESFCYKSNIDGNYAKQDIINILNNWEISDYDSLNGESVVDLLNELVEENEQLRHELDSLTGCYCADNKEFKDYWRIGYDD